MTVVIYCVALPPSGATVMVMRWVDPKLDINKFTSVYIEPTQLYPKPQPTVKIPQATLNGITRYYDQALKREIGKSLPLAAGPGPGVIVVRAAITAVSSKTESLKPYEVISIALVAAAVNTASGIRAQETDLATEALVGMIVEALHHSPTGRRLNAEFVTEFFLSQRVGNQRQGPQITLGRLLEIQLGVKPGDRFLGRRFACHRDLADPHIEVPSTDAATDEHRHQAETGCANCNVHIKVLMPKVTLVPASCANCSRPSPLL